MKPPSAAANSAEFRKCLSYRDWLGPEENIVQQSLRSENSSAESNSLCWLDIQYFREEPSELSSEYKEFLQSASAKKIIFHI